MILVTIFLTIILFGGVYLMAWFTGRGGGGLP